MWNNKETGLSLLTVEAMTEYLEGLYPGNENISDYVTLTHDDCTARGLILFDIYGELVLFARGRDLDRFVVAFDVALAFKDQMDKLIAVMDKGISHIGLSYTDESFLDLINAHVLVEVHDEAATDRYRLEITRMGYTAMTIHKELKKGIEISYKRSTTTHDESSPLITEANTLEIKYP